MCHEQIFDENLIALHPAEPLETSTDVIRLLGQLMVKNGYVNTSYIEAVLEREKQFPTGLQIQPFGAAIPHADSNGVKRSGVAIAILSKSVPFKNMADPERHVDVKLVFLLAVKEGDKQVGLLQYLATLLQQEQVVAELASAVNPSAVMQVLNRVSQKVMEERDG